MREKYVHPRKNLSSFGIFGNINLISNKTLTHIHVSSGNNIHIKIHFFNHDKSYLINIRAFLWFSDNTLKNFIHINPDPLLKFAT